MGISVAVVLAPDRAVAASGRAVAMTSFAVLLAPLTVGTRRTHSSARAGRPAAYGQPRTVSRMRSLRLVLGFVLILLVLPARAYAAEWDTTVVYVDCGTAGKASVAADGTARGFAECGGQNIFYFDHPLGQDASGRFSPYHGKVLATAWDGVSVTYVLYREGTAVKIGGRVGDTGAFVSPTTLSSNGLADGDLVASSGKWWAVWPERVGTNTDLYQAHTLLGTATRHRLTVAANWDAEPSLSLAAGRLMLAWTRSASATSAAGPSHIYLATSTGGPWAGRQYTGGGITNAHPSLAVGHQDKVVWNRDGRALIGRTSGGVEHDFGPSSPRAELAKSGPTVMVAWDVGGSAVNFATSSTGNWGPSQHVINGSLIFLLARGGKGQIGWYFQPPDNDPGTPTTWLSVEP